MSKKAQTVTVEFLGTDVKIENVRVVDIGRGNGGSMIHLDVRHQAVILHSAFACVNRVLVEPVEFTLHRLLDGPRYFQEEGGTVKIDIDAYTVVKVSNPCFHLDRIGEGYRLTHSTPEGFIQEMASVTGIRLTPTDSN